MGSVSEAWPGLRDQRKGCSSGTLAPGCLTLDNALNKMLCDPVKDGEASTSLQPWQIYSGLFLGFWAFSAFFDHFLATALLCLVFGAAGDQLTRYMYTLGSSMTGSGLDKGEVVTLLDMARQEASLVP